MICILIHSKSVPDVLLLCIVIESSKKDIGCCMVTSVARNSFTLTDSLALFALIFHRPWTAAVAPVLAPNSFVYLVFVGENSVTSANYSVTFAN